MYREYYGTAEDGQNVDAFTLSNKTGLTARILTFGGIIASLKVPDCQGRTANVVLGLDSLAGYAHRSPHFGALTGRYANRIARGRFTLDGVEYRLPTNAGPNAIHGGPRGFHKVVWRAASGDGEALILRHLSPDGDEGYPGNLAVEVIYSVADPNELRIEYSATTDRPTIINLTNHSYFNLAGEGTGDILGHVVSIEADHFTPVDSTMIPTGEIRPVLGTPFDFTSPIAIGARIRMGDEQIVRARGYDHNWVLRNPSSNLLATAARAFEPTTGRILEVLTDAPGLQVYTANDLSGTLVGPGGKVYRQGDGICFETQRFPDAPNQPTFPSAVLRPGEYFRSATVFRFSTAKG